MHKLRFHRHNTRRLGRVLHMRGMRQRVLRSQSCGVLQGDARPHAGRARLARVSCQAAQAPIGKQQGARLRRRQAICAKNTVGASRRFLRAVLRRARRTLRRRQRHRVHRFPRVRRLLRRYRGGAQGRGRFARCDRRAQIPRRRQGFYQARVSSKPYGVRRADRAQHQTVHTKTQIFARSGARRVYLSQDRRARSGHSGRHMLAARRARLAVLDRAAQYPRRFAELRARHHEGRGELSAVPLGIEL